MFTRRISNNLFQKESKQPERRKKLCTILSLFMMSKSSWLGKELFFLYLTAALCYNAVMSFLCCLMLCNSKTLCIPYAF